MPYNLQDKRDFFEKDLKYSIGQGVGNAFSKAVDVIISRGVQGKTLPQILEEVLPLRDMFFNENQGKMNFEIKRALMENPIQDWYEEQKGKDEEMTEAQNNIIDVGISL